MYSLYNEPYPDGRFGCRAVSVHWCCDTSVLNPVSTELSNLIVALEGDYTPSIKFDSEILEH